MISEHRRKTKMTNTIAQPEAIKTAYIDMDGTVARFHVVSFLERMYEENFFRNLNPFARFVAGLNLLISNHPEVKFCVLSAYPPSPFAKEEKNRWLDEHLPIENRIFVPMGENKSDYIPFITKNDYLIDDYTLNLLEWDKAGGTGIKVKNDFNCKNGVWQGYRVDALDTPEAIARNLEFLMDIDNKV